MKIVKLYECEIINANTLRVAAGTTGYCGGDSGHGSRTFIEIEDRHSTDITVTAIEPGPRGNGGVRIELGGDAELTTMMEALEFILKTLRRQASGDAK